MMGSCINMLLFVLVAFIGAAQSEVNTAYNDATTDQACVAKYQRRTKGSSQESCQEITDAARCISRAGGFMGRTPNDTDNARFIAQLAPITAVPRKDCPLDIKTLNEKAALEVASAVATVLTTGDEPDGAMTMS
ncbi:unnamed protein product, partial [Candidula unifasciata]